MLKMLVKIERESLAGESIKSKLPVLGKFPRIWEKMNLTVSMTRTIIDPTMNHDRERSSQALNLNLLTLRLKAPENSAYIHS